MTWWVADFDGKCFHNTRVSPIGSAEPGTLSLSRLNPILFFKALFHLLFPSSPPLLPFPHVLCCCKTLPWPLSYIKHRLLLRPALNVINRWLSKIDTQTHTHTDAVTDTDMFLITGGLSSCERTTLQHSFKNPDVCVEHEQCRVWVWVTGAVAGSDSSANTQAFYHQQC